MGTLSVERKRLASVLSGAFMGFAATAALAQADATSMDHKSMPGMDHSSMKGMGQDSMKGMDHSSMPGMSEGAKASPMKEMDHGSMKGMGQNSMKGMDHSSMPGMSEGAKNQPMQGMDHGSMDGMLMGSFQNGPAVGTLPTSDGTTDHRYSAYDINPHMMDDMISTHLLFYKLGEAYNRYDETRQTREG